VPQLCLPQGADQFRNAAAGARAGAALVLAPDEADGESVAAGVRRLLDEPAFAEAARAVQAEIAAMPSPAEVADAVLQG
jgi:UDP:flavonoid glycosyltransferase YjiC (YdhE family)